MNAALPINGTGLNGDSDDSAVNAATKKLRDDRFLRAQRLESIGMLASGIAHDLNNVLAPIILAAPLLRERATNPDDLRVIMSLEKSAERGVDLVRQILSFAQGVGGLHQAVEVKTLLDETMSVVRESFPKDINLDARVQESLWPIVADPTQVHQVLLNLCVNARDAMRSGGTLTLNAENCLLSESAAARIEGASAGAWVVLHVADTGTGIPPDVLAHIWEPFFTTKGAEGGTGLGLSTVRGIVENHKGFITLSTQPGKGTTFRVHLPAAEIKKEGGNVEPIQPGSMEGAGELIVVVDDDARIREMTAAILSRHGYRVLTASDGTEAVAIFAARGSEISMIITDVRMPNLDGAALANVVLQLNPLVKILAMSGLSSGGQNGQMQRYAGAFLYKPFKIEALLHAVHGLLHSEAAAEKA
jgi:nitrogen-specific signal transduction histidine kinase/ActR/RegA family two-component response regulator